MILTANATIVRLRWASLDTDEYGDPPTDDPDRTTLTGWAVGPSSTESIDDRGRQGLVVGLTLLGPYDGDVDPHRDRIEVNGEPYRMVGDVARFKSALTGWAAGLTVELRHGEG